jgi:1-deoxy-D-xylulose-5-phosphate reductoisomerase
LQQLLILGSTGSIGVNTLDVVLRHPDRYAVYALTAHSSVEKMLEQCNRFRPEKVVMVDAGAAGRLRKQLAEQGLDGITVLSGESALEDVAGSQKVDCVMAAIVGAAGLPATLKAAASGKRILLANKEALVMAGPLFMQAVRDGGATLLPIDSEHNAIFQCLPAGRPQLGPGIKKVLLTGSGGPFLHSPLDSLDDVTPDQACKHPNWTMGQKISVDSATMMNKGLELIEACWLFNLQPENIEVVIHPQSIVHSMVEYVDGSTLAQMGNPDMRTPIAYGLAWPERMDAGVGSLDLVKAGQLDFLALDEERFPALTLAANAFRQGGTSPAVFNAANEIAVAAFLAGTLGFRQIVDIVAAVLEQSESRPVDSLGSILEADREARELATSLIQARET